MSQGVQVAKSASKERGILLQQIREVYGRSVYNHKTREKQADICWNKHTRQRRLVIGFTAISSGAFLASFSGILATDYWAPFITSSIAVLISAMNLGVKNFQHGDEAQKHRDIAAQLWEVRESYLSLITDFQDGALSLEEARRKRDDLQGQNYNILKDAPRTSTKAYLAAQKGLKDNEEHTFSVKEIDLLLPKGHRLGDLEADKHDDQ